MGASETSIFLMSACAVALADGLGHLGVGEALLDELADVADGVERAPAVLLGRRDQALRLPADRRLGVDDAEEDLLLEVVELRGVDAGRQRRVLAAAATGRRRRGRGRRLRLGRRLRAGRERQQRDERARLRPTDHTTLAGRMRRLDIETRRLRSQSTSDPTRRAAVPRAMRRGRRARTGRTCVEARDDEARWKATPLGVLEMLARARATRPGRACVRRATAALSRSRPSALFGCRPRLRRTDDHVRRPSTIDDDATSTRWRCSGSARALVTAIYIRAARSALDVFVDRRASASAPRRATYALRTSIHTDVEARHGLLAPHHDVDRRAPYLLAPRVGYAWRRSRRSVSSMAAPRLHLRPRARELERLRYIETTYAPTFDGATIMTFRTARARLCLHGGSEAPTSCSP